MKTIITALLGSIACFGVVDTAAAQPGATRIAYDQCLADGWELVCSVGMVVDGSDGLAAHGVGPRWSPDGSKVLFTGPTDPSAPYFPWDDWAEILVLNLADGSVATLTSSANNWGPVWSRDGATIAFMSDRDGSTELYVMDANGANATRVTNNAGFTGQFRWSPDNGRFVIASNRDGSTQLYVSDAAGSNLTRLTDNLAVTGSFNWSADGSRIAFDCLIDGGGDVCAINADGTNFVRLTNDPARDSGAVFSPVDGRIAFVTERFGADPEIAVLETDGAITRVAAGTGGGRPVWAPDGNRLIFVSTIPDFYSGTCDAGDGAHNADDFCVPVFTMFLVHADGTGLTAIASGDNPDWFRPLPGQPVAALTPQCSGVVCDFDATGSFDADGTIVSYQWQFGDGASSYGPSAHHDYATGNQYGVSLTVIDDSGAAGVSRVVVRANTAPIAAFTIACDGPTCAFDGSGSSDPDGTVARYEWFFGDGNWGGTAPTANHTYHTGTYSVTLIVTDNGGATTTMVTTVSVVNVPPVAAFTSSCNGTMCIFDGSASSDPDGHIWYYSWTFGYGTTGNGAIVSHLFAAGSTYTVTLVVDDLYGSGSRSQPVTIAGANTPPAASFISSCSELQCSFDASASSDADGTIATYTFNFGDGTTSVGGGWGPWHIYAANGSYTVTLTVTDNGGLTAQTAHLVAVALNKPPVASFTSSCGGFTCTVNGSGSADPDGTIASFTWNFGDGATGSGPTSTHTYAAGGTYGVTLTVLDNQHAASQTSRAITVNKPPVASFTSACSALACSFNGSGSSDPDGAIASYAWNFGDGATGSGVAVNHSYALGGSYMVTLAVTDNVGAAGTQAANVAVAPPPAMHVGDLDRAGTLQANGWTATVTITIHDSNHKVLANAVVSGTWSDAGMASCTTNANGWCALSKSGIAKKTGSVAFSVTTMALGSFPYKSADNHDPDGDSNGTSISVTRP